MKKYLNIFILCICSLMCISCAQTKEKMTRPDGSTYTFVATQVGGAGVSKGSSGASQTFDGQKSFQDLATATTLVAGSIASTVSTSAKELTTQTANNNAAAVSKNAANNATIHAGQQEATKQLGLKLAAEAAAKGGG